MAFVRFMRRGQPFFDQACGCPVGVEVGTVDHGPVRLLALRCKPLEDAIERTHSARTFRRSAYTGSYVALILWGHPSIESRGLTDG